jgi:type IV pilus assembly protein PilA
MYRTALQRLRAARSEDIEGEGAGEAGFTLIELMVVLLIIAILLAIAIPTFLGVTKSANDRAAQSNLTNAVTEATAIFQANNQTFPTPSTAFSSANTDAYQSSAPEFQWASAASTATNLISVNNKSATELVLAVLSQTGTCWVVDVNENAGTTYGENKAVTSGKCNAAGTITGAISGTSYGTASSVTFS